MSMSEPPLPVQADAEARRCKQHPDVETGLSCGRCDTPICPRCMVQTPVGARCRDCARMRRLPIFEVGPRTYALAAAAALAAAVALGLLWALLPARGMLLFLAALAVGMAAGEAVARAANRKRSAGLKGIAAAAVPLAYLVSLWAPLAERISAMAQVLGPGIIPEALWRIAVAALSDPLTLLALALGAFFAAARIDR